MKCNCAYWHFDVSLLSNNVFIDALKFFGVAKQKKNSYLQQWWDIGKGNIKLLCLQYTLNVTRDTRDITKSMKVLENEIEDLQGLANSTKDGERFKDLKRKKCSSIQPFGFFLFKVL